MKKLFIIRSMIVSFIALIILIWAFWQNNIFGKAIILPFLICSLAKLFESLFLLLNKNKIANAFKYIFRVSFFAYIFGFLAYMVYYAIVNKTYSVLIIVAVFLFFTICFIKNIFSNIK